MILTGHEIKAQHAGGHVTIEPFDADCINPCSYTYRLGPQLGVPNLGTFPVTFETIDIPDEGYVLQPGRMYLGHTLEVLGSDHFTGSLIGRSSLGRVGLFLQVSANLIHVGAKHQITLELVAAMPLRIYKGLKIGEISFWQQHGVAETVYRGGYSAHNAPTQSKLSGDGHAG